MSKEQPVFGIDVHSEYQRELNFERARAEGYEFCVIKATEGPYRDGDTYVPSGFKEFFRRAEAEGFVMGVYAFLLSTPARAQADHFLRTIEAVGGPEDKILMVDFEDYMNYPALTPGNAQLEDFIAEVKRRVGDHPIVVYSGRGFWNGGDSSGGFDQYGADAAWDAYYLHMDPVRPKQFYANSDRSFRDAGIAWGWGKPWGGVEPWFWQFTSAGSVAGMNIDVNAYRGTGEQLLALTGVKEGGAVDGGGAEDPGARDGEARGGGTRDGKRRVLTHGVIDGTNFAEGYKYIMQLNNHMKYWVWSSGPVPEGEGAYAANKPLPPVDQLKGKRIFCLTGETEVVAKDLERSYKRPYSGEVITIQTASGAKLTGTPNHPVLTDKGWLPLHALRKGGYVLSGSRLGERAGLDPDDVERPARLEDVHGALADSWSVERNVSTPLDFHGDGRDGEVEVVVSERVLRDRIQAALFEHVFQFEFSDPAQPHSAFAVLGRPDEETAGIAPPPRFMGGANLSEPLGLGHSGVLEDLRLRVASSYAHALEPRPYDLPGRAEVSRNLTLGHSAEVEVGNHVGIDVGLVEGRLSGGFPARPVEAGTVFDGPEFDASLPEPSLDEAGGNAELPGEFTGGLAGNVFRDRIVSVDVRVFDGHVYNLQTASEWYFANGIVSHNCAGVPNIIRRATRQNIPTRGNALYDGGIASYFYTSAFGGLGPGFFSGVDVPFHLATAKKWARETGSGVLVGRSYRNNSLAGQGHVAVLLPDGKVLQSFQFGADGEPGLNTDYTIEESHAGGYYEIMVHPKDWIDLDRGRDDKGRDEKERDEKERDEKRRREPTDEEPRRPEPVPEFTDEEFEEIGREVLKLFSRLRQNRTRRRGDARPRGREEH